MPSPRRHHEPAIAPAAGLAREALMDVLAGRAPAVDKRLLVVVARDGDRLLGDLGGDVHDATALARRLALAEARGTQGRLHDGLLRGGWLAIAGVDRIGRPDRQRMIATLLDVPPSSLSFHLKELAHAQLVTSRQEGRFVFYGANFATMNGLLSYLTENCCGGNPCSPVSACSTLGACPS